MHGTLSGVLGIGQGALGAGQGALEQTVAFCQNSAQQPKELQSVSGLCRYVLLCSRREVCVDKYHRALGEWSVLIGITVQAVSGLY